MMEQKNTLLLRQRRFENEVKLRECCVIFFCNKRRVRDKRLIETIVEARRAI